MLFFQKIILLVIMFVLGLYNSTHAKSKLRTSTIQSISYLKKNASLELSNFHDLAKIKIPIQDSFSQFTWGEINLIPYTSKEDRNNYLYEGGIAHRRSKNNLIGGGSFFITCSSRGETILNPGFSIILPMYRVFLHGNGRWNTSVKKRSYKDYTYLYYQYPHYQLEFKLGWDCSKYLTLFGGGYYFKYLLEKNWIPRWAMGIEIHFHPCLSGFIKIAWFLDAKEARQEQRETNFNYVVGIRLQFPQQSKFNRTSYLHQPLDRHFMLRLPNAPAFRNSCYRKSSAYSSPEGRSSITLEDLESEELNNLTPGPMSEKSDIESDV